MDKFGVPKKVNRHVLKAMYFINRKGHKNSRHSDIMKVVRATLKHNIPKDLSIAVQKSLKNLSKLGVIRRWGTTFSIHKKKSTSVLDLRTLMNNKINQAILPIVPLPVNNKQKEENKSRLDPNLKRRHISDCSSSEGDIEKTRKRFHTYRPFVKKGQAVFLPKARISPTNPGKTMESFTLDYTSRKVFPSKKLKCDLFPNSRKRRHSETSTESATKKKRFRLSKPVLRKRRRIANKPRLPRTFNLCLQNDILGLRERFGKTSHFKRTKNNPVAKNIEPLYDEIDDIEIIVPRNELRIKCREFPKLTEHIESSDLSMIDRSNVVTAKKRRPVTMKNLFGDNFEPLHDDNDDTVIIEPQKEKSFGEHDNLDHNETSSVSLGHKNKGVTAKQSQITRRSSVRKVYKSDHFTKDSNIKIDSNQKKNEIKKANVTKPSSERAVNSAQQTDEQPNKSISSKIVKVDASDYYT